MSHGLEPVRVPKKLKVTVQGNSMSPTFKDGDKVQFLSLDGSRLNVGDIVLVRHPFQKRLNIIKRIKEIKSRNLYFLEGDNNEIGSSSDSHSFGLVSKKNILAVTENKFKTILKNKSINKELIC